MGLRISNNCTVQHNDILCLRSKKKIDKIAYSIVLGVIFLYGSVKSRDFEQFLVCLGLNFQFYCVPKPKYMMTIHENIEFSIFQTAS